MRKWYLFLLFITIVLIFTKFLISSNKTIKKNLEKITVSYIDVGHGDSIFIDISGKYKVLIDSGPPGQYHYFYYKKKQGIHYFLNKNKIDDIDVYVLSHPHIDHIGGLKKIIKKIKVNQVIDPGIAYPLKEYEDCLKLIEEKKIPYKIVRSKYSWNYKDVRFEVLNPKIIKTRSSEDINNYSIVLKMTYQSISFLFTSDIEQYAEKELLDDEVNLESTILKVPHQGSDDSNHSEFLQKVSPKLAILSCGYNLYGHPSPVVLERYKKMKIPIYRTDHHGTIIITTNGTNYQVRHTKNRKDNNEKN